MAIKPKFHVTLINLSLNLVEVVTWKQHLVNFFNTSTIEINMK